MKISAWLIGFVLIMVVLFGSLMLLGSVAKDYEVNYNDTQFNNTLNQVNLLYNVSTDMSDATYQSEIDNDDALTSGIYGSYKAIKQAPRVLGLFNAIITDISDVVMIPSIFIKLAITTITILLAGTFIYFFTGRKD